MTADAGDVTGGRRKLPVPTGGRSPFSCDAAPPHPPATRIPGTPQTFMEPG